MIAQVKLVHRLILTLVQIQIGRLINDHFPRLCHRCLLDETRGVVLSRFRWNFPSCAIAELRAWSLSFERSCWWPDAARFWTLAFGSILLFRQRYCLFDLACTKVWVCVVKHPLVKTREWLLRVRSLVFLEASSVLFRLQIVDVGARFEVFLRLESRFGASLWKDERLFLNDALTRHLFG